mgnify:FL=1
MKKKIIIILSIILGILGIIFYSRFIETSLFETKEYKISNVNLANDFSGLKIIHISDIHYGRITSTKMIKKIIKEVNLIKPDIIVITGDLIDKDATLTEKDISFLKDSLAKLESKYGKYSIYGNHDITYSREKIEEIYKYSNFKLLVNDYDIIYGKKNEALFIGGLDSLLEGEQNIEKTMSYFNDHEDILYKILLVHEPDSTDNILEKYPNTNLILAGHSHNGQVRLPLIGAIYTPSGSKKYYDNYYKINETDLYISSGIGVSRINFRLFNKPSINFYRIYND